MTIFSNILADKKSDLVERIIGGFKNPLSTLETEFFLDGCIVKNVPKVTTPANRLIIANNN